ncbi:hypothetical protein BGZ46_002181 [Entomortierella lignicola]|nr:hypothetical protein BGZ46_002181 [Entomortierella lignicola]
MPPKKKASTRKTKAAIAAEEAAANAAKAEAPISTGIVEDNAEAQEEIKEEKAEPVKIKKTKTTTVKTTTRTTTVIPQDDTKVVEEEEEEKEEEPKPKKSSSKKKSKEAEQVDSEMKSSIVEADQDQEMKEVEPSQSLTEETSSTSSTMAERLAKLKGLRQKMNASKQANRADLMTEHQKSKINKREEAKKERVREEAEKLMSKRDAEEAGEDYERSQFWNYSAESVERWNEKQEAKKLRMDNKFTDWDQVNHKKYLKQVGELKPNLAAYNAKKEAATHTNEDGELVVSSDSGFYRDANSVAFLSDAKPDSLAVDRLAADVAKQIDARTRFSKRRAQRDDEDVNYINDANRRFNQKISRFYDKHTKEIRDDFERGTAL